MENYNSYDNEKKAVTYGLWRVELDGTMTNEKKHYVIDSDRLTEADWVVHLMKKDWCDLNTIIPAYFQAIKNIGHQYIDMIVNY